jgi:hypothetical protein
VEQADGRARQIFFQKHIDVAAMHFFTAGILARKFRRHEIPLIFSGKR